MSSKIGVTAPQELVLISEVLPQCRKMKTSSGVGLSNLPQSVFNYAMSLLSLRDLAKALPTCKAFHASADGIYKRSLQDLSSIKGLSTFFEFSQKSAKQPRTYTQILDKATNLRSLYITPIGRDSLLVLNAIFASRVLAQLTVLWIYESGMFDEILRKAATLCTNLTEISLCGKSNLTDEGTAILETLPKLQKVDFQSSNMSKKTVETLVRMPSVTEVDLSYCYEIKIDAIAALFNAPALRRLHIGRNKAKQSEIIDVIAERGNLLTHLCLHDKGFHDDSYYTHEELCKIARCCQRLVLIKIQSFGRTVPAKTVAAMRALNPRLQIEA